jgi:hypothetical protein
MPYTCDTQHGKSKSVYVSLDIVKGIELNVRASDEDWSSQ